MSFSVPRRFYLRAMRAAERQADGAVAMALRVLHAATPGTPLPPAFPARDALVVRGYTALEDVRGATPDELVAEGLGRFEAAAALAAAAEP